MPPVKNNFQRGWRIFMPELSPPSDPIARRGASTTTRDRLAQPARHRISPLGVLLLTSVLMMLDMAKASGADPEFDFDVPPSPASKALVLFARQANIQLLFPYEAVSTVQLKGISGRYTAKDGIEALIAGTCLEATLSTETDTTLKISRQTRGFWFMRNDNCKPRKHKKVLSSVLAAGIGVSAGMAHGAEPVQPAVLDEIIVTAQKREQNLQQVPLSITAISGPQLKTRGIESAADLSALAPNLQVSKSPGSGLISQISIRGSATTQPAIYVDPAVGMYVDGVYIAKAQGNLLELLDLERVEVLRGPQGSLFGRNTIAGAINFITRKPSGEFGGSASLDFGNYGHHIERISVDLPRLGVASVNFGFRNEKSDGWMKNSSGPAMGDANKQALRLSTLLEIQDDLKVDFSYDHTDIDQHPTPQSLFALSGTNGTLAGLGALLPGEAGTFLVNAASQMSPLARKSRPTHISTDHNAPLWQKLNNDGYAASVTYEIDDRNTLKYIGSHRRMEYRDRLDQDGTPQRILYSRRETDLKTNSHEVQWIGSTERFHYIVGYFQFEENGSTDGGPSTAMAPIGAQYRVNMYKVKTKSRAWFGQLDYDITDQLVLTAGLRGTRETRSNDAGQYLTNGFLGPIIAWAVPWTHASASFSATTPSISIAYQVTPNVNAYARYAKGFRSGGFSGEATSVQGVSTPYGPEKTTMVELGIKSIFFDDKMQLNAALFENRTTDMQLTRLLPGTTSSISFNAGEATTRGFELEGAYVPVDGWRLQFSLGYLHAEFDEYMDYPRNAATAALAGVSTAELINTAGNRVFPFAPKYTANFNIDGRLAVTPWGTLKGSIDYTYTDSLYITPANKSLTAADAGAGSLAAYNRLPSVALVNARLTLTDIPIGDKGAIELAFWVRNLTDEDKMTNLIDFSYFRNASWMTPRTYGASASYTW